MHATVGFAKGECILSEPPLVRGRCTADRCPGCPSVTAQARGSHAPDCFWAAVEQQPTLQPAVEWYRGVSGASETADANYVRVCCLLAICIQAAASSGLRSWLLHALRSSIHDVNDLTNPIIKNTRGFALKFALKIPPPPSSDDAFAPAMSAVDWSDELFTLLLHLQTNLFEIDDRTIGIYPSAFLYEHACAPNARMDRGGRGGAEEESLQLNAIRPIAAGEAVTFCYCDDNPKAVGLVHEVLAVRRPFILSTLGFRCVCATCEHEAALQRTNPRVFLDIAIAGAAVGRIEISLRSDLAPRTCENFRCLCTGEKGVGSRGQLLHYKGSAMHRIIRGFMAQGGAAVGESIYGRRFDDETFALRHTGAGIVSMANSGPDSNTSGFFICLANCDHNDGKHCAFGAVAEGMDVVRAIEAVGTDGGDGQPSQEVVIANCGEL